ncbi:hypothetical protein [Streptomyces sp. NPDC023588]|uniref:hypothetical protein n=1 Tax=Streptomyces sp. NPDC023588 TaxID=3154907 RepID=UPI0033FF631E
MTERADTSGPGTGRGAGTGGVLGPLLWALLGLALLALSAVPSLAVPGQLAVERAFLEARPCADEPAADATTDCLRTVRGTARSAQYAKSARAVMYQVQLRPPVPAPADRPLNLDPDGPLAERIQPGDTVEVTTWRNLLVAVSHDGVRETLPGLPDEDPAMSVGFTLIGVWLAALAFAASLGSARRTRALAAGRPFVPPVRFGPAKWAGVLVVPLAAGFLSGSVWDGWTAVAMTVALSSLIAVPATIAALRWDRDEV